MKKIASFTINHDILTPGMYISRVDGDVITYDLRCKYPNKGDYLAQGALNMTGVAAFFSWFAPMILLLSALLTAGYLFPISMKGFLPGRNADGSLKFFEKKEPTHVMLIPLVLLTTLSLVAGMFPNGLVDFLTKLASTLM